MCLLHWKPSEGCELTFSLNFLLKLYAGRKRFSFFLFGVEVTFSAGWVQVELYGHKGGRRSQHRRPAAREGGSSGLCRDGCCSVTQQQELKAVTSLAPLCIAPLLPSCTLGAAEYKLRVMIS